MLPEQLLGRGLAPPVSRPSAGRVQGGLTGASYEDYLRRGPRPFSLFSATHKDACLPCRAYLCASDNQVCRA
jgi:hypothetical protein